jgi:hypothetical protein
MHHLEIEPRTFEVVTDGKIAFIEFDGNILSMFIYNLLKKVKLVL